MNECLELHIKKMKEEFNELAKKTSEAGKIEVDPTVHETDPDSSKIPNNKKKM